MIDNSSRMDRWGATRWGLLQTVLVSTTLLVAGCSSGSSGPDGGTGAPGNGYSFSVGDDSLFHVRGPQGGPFPEGTRDYELINGSDTAVVEWAALASVPWLSFSETGGDLAPGASTWVTVEIDQALAATLDIGDYPADIVFRDKRNPEGEIYLAFLLTVHPPDGGDGLVVTPEEDILIEGVVGETLDPSEVIYVLGNDAGHAIDWAVSVDVPWLVPDAPLAGSLDPHQTHQMSVDVDEQVLAGFGAGVHRGVVTFEQTAPEPRTLERHVDVLLDGPPPDGDGNGRVTDGLAALYDFEEGAGTMVRDVSGVGTPLDLTIADPQNTTWMPGALRLDQATMVSSGGAGKKLFDACTANHEITIEAWIDPANLTQDGPARVVTLSDGSSLRNFTLGQGLWGGQPADTFNVRLRTTTTDLDGMPLVTTSQGSAKPGLQHVVYTRAPGGTARIYVDGLERVQDTVFGDLSNWDSSYGFALGNELGANRPWLGALHLVAVYDRALSAAEVQQNYDAGTGDADVGTIKVDPGSDFSVTGVEGNSLSDTEKVYTISNPGSATVQWSVTVDEVWAFVDGASGGWVDPGQSVDVEIELDAAKLLTFPAGVYEAVISFDNLTNGLGATTRDIYVNIKSEDDDGGGGDYGDRPGPHNTGPYDESILVPSGSITVTKDGTLIENVKVSGGITVQANNVTIRNFIIDGGGGTFYGVRCESGYSGTVIEDGEITRTESSGIYGWGFTARRLEIHEQGADGLKCRDNTLVEGCWIHHIGMNDGAHADGNQSRVGKNIVLRGNFFDLPHNSSGNGPGPPYKSNANGLFQSSLGDIDGAIVEGNWLNGGGYTVFFIVDKNKGDYDTKNCKLINNRFGRDFQYGPLSVSGNVTNLTISGNVWDDTGELMDIND